MAGNIKNNINLEKTMKGKIFNAQEVQALIAGNKTQFREIVKGQPTLIGTKASYAEALKVGSLEGHRAENREDGWWICDDYAGSGVECPYQVGQKIFCKESFCYNPKGGVNYYADHYSYNLPHDLSKTQKNARYMKQEHSRVTLLIKEIKVERLASISCADYFAETGRRPISHMDLDCDTPDPRNDFAAYWNATHKKREEKFEASPFVWVISCEVVK